MTIYCHPVATRPPLEFGKCTNSLLQGFPASEIWPKGMHANLRRDLHAQETWETRRPSQRHSCVHCSEKPHRCTNFHISYMQYHNKTENQLMNQTKIWEKLIFLRCTSITYNRRYNYTAVDKLSFHSTFSPPNNTTLFIAEKIVEKTPLPNSMLLVCSSR